MGRFTDGIVAAACQAVRGAVPGEVAVTAATIDGVGCNRLSPDGPRDPEAGIVIVRRQSDHSLLAVQLIYSMHPTVLHEDSTLVSSDFPGLARRRIEEALAGAVVCYHTGPAGNLSPRYHVREQTFAEAERLGGLLAQPVLAAIDACPDSSFCGEVSLGGASTHVALPARVFSSVAQAEAELAAARDEFDRLRRAGAPHGPVRTAECTVFGAEEQVMLARAEESGAAERLRAEYGRAEVQVLRVGDAFLVGLPGECFVEYALDIKGRAGRRAFVISLANGELQGYVVTPEAHGYEARLSFFLPEAGRLMADAAVELIASL